MEEKLKKVHNIKKAVPQIFQIILNISLTILALVLSLLLFMEIIDFLQMIYSNEKRDYKYFLANILVFFLYFEFITMIVKY
ncbi:MAG: phosphate-starvation-inducible protein PsiE, partial [Kurthia sp.]